MTTRSELHRQAGRVGDEPEVLGQVEHHLAGLQLAGASHIGPSFPSFQSRVDDLARRISRVRVHERFGPRDRQVTVHPDVAHELAGHATGRPGQDSGALCALGEDALAVVAQPADADEVRADAVDAMTVWASALDAEAARVVVLREAQDTGAALTRSLQAGAGFTLTDDPDAAPTEAVDAGTGEGVAYDAGTA